MPSTYSTDLRIELIPNGEQSGTWGTTTNNNLGTLIEDAIAGAATVSVITTNQALTAANGAADEARCAALILTTTTGAPFNIFAPPVTKLYVIYNASAYNAVIYCSTVLGNTTAAGAGYDLPAGRTVFIRSNGTVFTGAVTHTDTLTLGSALGVSSGGLGLTSIAAKSIPVANNSNTYTTVTPAAGQSVRINSGNTAWEAFTPGTVTGVTASSPVASSGGAAPNITLSAGYGDTQNPYGTKAVNTILAGPSSGSTAAAPTFRSLVAADLPNTAVAAGSYTNTNITVDAQGRITAASNGSSGGGGDVSFTGTAPTASVNQVAVYGASGTSITTGRTYQFRATTAGPTQLQLFENLNNGTESIIIQAPASIATSASATYTLPSAVPAANGYVLSSTTAGVMSWVAQSTGAGTITEVVAGNGMSFTTVSSGSATVTMGAPSAITSSSTNSASAGTHTHAITGAAFLAGAQTFSGKKTFTGGIISQAYNFTDPDESIYAVTSVINLSIASTSRIRLTFSDFQPTSDDQIWLGFSANRWKAVYAVNGTIQTSDQNEKQDIADLDATEKRVAARIKGLIKKFRFKDSVAEKGDAARIHVGVIAQEVRDAFAAEGLDAYRYGLFCSDTWWEKSVNEVYPPTGEMRTVNKVYREPVEGGIEKTRLGVRYDELLAFVIAAM